MNDTTDKAPADVMTPPELIGSPDDGTEDGNDFGSIRIHNNVIAVIARLAATKVPGVLDMSSSLVDGIAGMIGKKSDDRGIRVEVHENTVRIDLSVILAYGCRIPQVCWQIQTDVSEAVEQMTGKTVSGVNIVVQSVRHAAEEQEGQS